MPSAHDPPDVFFAPAYTAPLGAAMPLAVTIHDISFVAHPEWFRAARRPRRRWLTRRAAHAAAVVFTDSQFSQARDRAPSSVEPSRISGHTARRDSPRTCPAATIPAPRAAWCCSSVRCSIGGRFPTSSRRLRARPRDLSSTPGWRSSATTAHGRGRISPRPRCAHRRRATAPRSSATCRTRSLRICTRGRRCSPSCPSTKGFGLTPLEALSSRACRPSSRIRRSRARVYGDAAEFVPRGDIARPPRAPSGAC